MDLVKQDFPAWARSMIKPLQSRSGETEELRELPARTIDEARQAGMLSMGMPDSMGGSECDLHEILTTTRLLAQGCVSTAWTLSFYTVHNLFLARGPATLSKAVLNGAAGVLMPCPLAPTGTAVAAEGGHVVTGSWEWATGIQHADHVMVHAVVADSQPFETRMFVVPVSDVTIDDVWHTAGMRGTGSNTVNLDAVHVPSDRSMLGTTFQAMDPPGAQGSDYPLLRFPMVPVMALVAASPALGGAEAAVEHFRERVESRVLAYSADRQAEQPAGQIRLAEAQATVRAARLVWEDAIKRTAAIVDNPDDMAARGRIRLAAAHTVRLSVQAVQDLMEASGASVHFEDSPIQRIARDLTTLRGHVIFDWDRTAQLAGKLELGFKPSIGEML